MAPIGTAGPSRRDAGDTTRLTALPAAMAGTQMVFAQIRLVADALFDLFQRGICDSWQLRDLSPRTTRIARLLSPQPEKRLGIICARERLQGRHEYRRYRPSPGATGTHRRGKFAGLLRPTLRR